MKSLVKAGNEIIKIALECENQLEDLPHVVGRIQAEIKVHGHPLPTIMILDLIEEFLNDREERKKSRAMEGFDEVEVEKAFGRVSRKWSGQENTN